MESCGEEEGVGLTLNLYGWYGCSYQLECNQIVCTSPGNVSWQLAPLQILGEKQCIISVVPGMTFPGAITHYQDWNTPGNKMPILVMLSPQTLSSHVDSTGLLYITIHVWHGLDHWIYINYSGLPCTALFGGLLSYWQWSDMVARWTWQY